MLEWVDLMLDSSDCIQTMRRGQPVTQCGSNYTATRSENAAQLETNAVKENQESNPVPGIILQTLP